MARNRLIIRASFSKLYTILLVTIPVLWGSISGFPASLLFSDYIIVICGIFLIVRNKPYCESGLQKELIILSTYVVLSFIVGKLSFQGGYLVGNGYYGILAAVLVLYVHAYKGSSVFDNQLAKRAIICISLLSMVGLFLQYFFHIVGGKYIRLIPIRLFSAQVKDLYSQVAYTGYKTGYFRPSSFFLEPAHYAQFCSFGVLALLTRRDGYEGRNFVLAILLSVSIVMTTSGLGFVTVFFLWISYVVFNMNGGNRTIRLLSKCVLLLLAIIGFYLLVETDTWNTLYSRLFSKGFQSVAIQGRSSSYNFWLDLPWYKKIIGVGYGFEPEGYYTGLALMLGRMGIIGTLLFLSPLVNHYKDSDTFGKFGTLLWIILFCSAGVGSMHSVVYYWPLLLSSRRGKQDV